LGVDLITASGHQWRGGSKGASLGGTRPVVLSWKPEHITERHEST
jgi:hypothetical protein